MEVLEVKLKEMGGREEKIEISCGVGFQDVIDYFVIKGGKTKVFDGYEVKIFIVNKLYNLILNKLQKLEEIEIIDYINEKTLKFKRYNEFYFKKYKNGIYIISISFESVKIDIFNFLLELVNKIQFRAKKTV